MASTIEAGRLPHAVHAQYLRPAQNGIATTYAVTRVRDGRSFSMRRASAFQAGKEMFAASASFHAAPALEAMPRWQQATRPDVRHPEQVAAGPMRGGLLLDVRAVEPGTTGGTRMWARASDPLPDDPVVHQCLLAYLADHSNGLFGTPMGGTDAISMDLVMWLHTTADLTRWVLMELEPVAVAMGRGTYRGTIFDEAGAVVATFVQEMFGIVRTNLPDRPGMA